MTERLPERMTERLPERMTGRKVAAMSTDDENLDKRSAKDRVLDAIVGMASSIVTGNERGVDRFGEDFRASFDAAVAEALTGGGAMPTLEEHNRVCAEGFQAQRKAEHLAGVACQMCRAHGAEVEMHYTRPGTVCLSDPPKRDVHCPKCNARGYKY